MQLRVNNNRDNIPMEKAKDTEFLKPMPVKMNYNGGNKKMQKAIKEKFHNEYRDSIKGINNQFDLDFVVEDCIGSGATGASFKAQSTKQRGKKFALKFLMEKKTNNSQVHHRRAKNEIKLQYNVKSQFITQIFGYYIINNDYCIVQDYEQLGDLNNFQKTILKGENFNENLLLLMSNNIIKALKHLNDLKICHFDVKKENILVDEFLNFKLSDFSVSESYYGIKLANLKNIGTSCYISPENHKKETISTDEMDKVDLWSLGVLLYKLANKEKYPFNISGKEQSLEEIQLKINNNSLNLDELDVSEELKDLIWRLLRKNIKERISLEELIKHPWVKKSEELLEEKNKYGDNLKFMFDIMSNKV